MFALKRVALFLALLFLPLAAVSGEEEKWSVGFIGGWELRYTETLDKNTIHRGLKSNGFVTVPTLKRELIPFLYTVIGYGVSFRPSNTGTFILAGLEYDDFFKVTLAGGVDMFEGAAAFTDPRDMFLVVGAEVVGFDADFNLTHILDGEEDLVEQ